jgi:hypothetical protein
LLQGRGAGWIEATWHDSSVWMKPKGQFVHKLSVWARVDAKLQLCHLAPTEKELVRV